MTDELEQRFFNDELDEQLRSWLLNELDQRRDGRVEFTFNTGSRLGEELG